MNHIEDTKSLLRECSAGIKMAIDAINEVFDKVDSPKLKDILSRSKREHDVLEQRIQASLTNYHLEDKEPGAVAKGMSWLKVNTKFLMDNGEDDKTVAELITDGCNMGIKNLRRFLNQYTGADHSSKDMTNELIDLEKDLLADMAAFL